MDGSSGWWWRIEDDRGAVGDDLRHGLSHLGGVESHHDDGIRAQEPSVFDHPVDRMSPRVFDESRILGDLAPAERSQPGRDVADEAPAADHDSEYLAEDAFDLIARGVFRRRNEHGRVSLSGSSNLARREQGREITT